MRMSAKIQVELTATQILEAIQRRPRVTPILIADETGMPPGMVRTILVTLTNLRLVTSPARGLYEITPLGEQILKENKGAVKK